MGEGMGREIGVKHFPPTFQESQLQELLEQFQSKSSMSQDGLSSGAAQQGACDDVSAIHQHSHAQIQFLDL